MKYIIAKPHSIYELGKRANQEDNIYPQHGKATTEDSLFIVCDGMGGHDSGEVASSTVCEVMSSYINENTDGYNFDEQCFKDALSATYDALDAKDNGAEKKMGTTMTFMKFHSKGCFMAHIGDSRMYHIRPSENKILFKSRDHSLVNDLFDLGEITEEELKTSRQKNIITRAIQPLQERRSRASIQQISDIKAGDYFYICTDGMLEEMEDNNILNIFSMDCDDSEKTRIFTELTVGNKDNHSAYIIRIEEVICDDVTIVTENEKPNHTPQIAQQNTVAPNRKLLKLIKKVIFFLFVFAIAFLAYKIYLKNGEEEVRKDEEKTEKTEQVEKPEHNTTNNIAPEKKTDTIIANVDTVVTTTDTVVTATDTVPPVESTPDVHIEQITIHLNTATGNTADTGTIVTEEIDATIMN